MQQDNSSYTVTSPDLMLTDDGPQILLSSTNSSLITEIKSLFERYINHSIVFNVCSSQTNENNVAWMWYVSRSADIVILDLDTCAWVDVCAAILKEDKKFHDVIYYTENKKRRDLVRLLNATSTSVILYNTTELDYYLKAKFDVNAPK
jgi:hypothetical protein|tara:strand:- start:5 stop:448 length:444 start_codon:yes stop_codon:yes gene_type:complete